MARKAGVSVSSVSRHLQGTRVRAADAIEQAIEELGYRPSPTARSLKSGITHSIGLVIPDIVNPFFAAVAKGAESIAQEAGYRVILANSDEDSDQDRSSIAAIEDHIDGLLFTPTADDEETIDVVKSLKVPTVLIDRAVDADVDSVLIDNRGGAAAAAEHLIELGHRQIAIVSGPENNTPGRERHEGFTESARKADDVEVIIERGDFREASGYQATMRLLGRSHPPTALFAANNLMTIGALMAIRDLGVRVPDSLSVVGFDDHPLADLLGAPLTVIDRPTDIQGAVAARMLLSRMSGEHPGPGREVRLETKLVLRSSTRSIEDPA